MTALWVSMALHVAAALFWVVTTLITSGYLSKREKELEEIYESSRQELIANIENVRKMAGEANAQYLRNMFEKK